MTDFTTAPRLDLPGWRLARGQHLCHYQWDGEFVLYNDLSGDTHLLGTAAMRLLEALAPGARSQAELDTCLPAASRGEAELADILADLERLALIEHCRC